MNSLNSVLIEGSLVADPQLSYSPKGTAICDFTIASNRYFKQDEEYHEEVSYFDVTTWNHLAEVCIEYLRRGRGVRVVGRLTQDQQSKRTYIFSEHVEFKPETKPKTLDQAFDEPVVAPAPEAKPKAKRS